MTGTEHECLKEEDIQKLKKLIENPDNSEEEKLTRYKIVFSSAKSCPICRRKLLKTFGT